MGGGRWFYFPTHIWTPAGGWYPSPKNWRANTMVMLGVIGVAAFSTFTLSASLEVGGRWSRWVQAATRVWFLWGVTGLWGCGWGGGRSGRCFVLDG